MQLMSIGLVALLLYTPLFIGFALYFALSRDGYLFSRGDISDLGQSQPGLKDEGFRVLVFIFGALNLLTVLVVYKIGSQVWYGRAAFYLFAAASLFLMSFSFFPENTRAKGHGLVGAGLFITTILSSVFLIPTNLSSHLLPDFLIIVNLLIVVFAFLFCWAELMETGFLKSSPLYVKGVHSLRGVWEWNTFFFSLAWVFVVVLLYLKDFSF